MDDVFLLQRGRNHVLKKLKKSLKKCGVKTSLKEQERHILKPIRSSPTLLSVNDLSNKFSLTAVKLYVVNRTAIKLRRNTVSSVVRDITGSKMSHLLFLANDIF